MNDQERKFYHHKATGKLPQRKPKESEGFGVLELDGKPVTQPLAYPLLQLKRGEYILQGINKKRLKIRKHYER